MISMLRESYFCTLFKKKVEIGYFRIDVCEVMLLQFGLIVIFSNPSLGLMTSFGYSESSA